MTELLTRYESGPGQESIALDLVKRAQGIAVACRTLYHAAVNCPDADKQLSLLREQGYRVERLGDAVRIELPLLLPKRGGDCSFLMQPLHELLSLQARGIQPYEECTVVFQHIYGKNRRLPDVRDHDNVEYRVLLNVIERYLLTSDSGYYCTNIQMTQFGERE